MILTFLYVIQPTTAGPMNPGKVANVLVRPISVPTIAKQHALSLRHTKQQRALGQKFNAFVNFSAKLFIPLNVSFQSKQQRNNPVFTDADREFSYTNLLRFCTICPV